MLRLNHIIMLEFSYTVRKKYKKERRTMSLLWLHNEGINQS